MRRRVVGALVAVAVGIAGRVQAHALGDLVFCDRNGNGVFDAGDAGLAGVTVARDCGGTLATTTTDADGRYVFTLTPSGTCRVSVDPSSPPVAGLALTTPRVGGPPLPTAEHSPFPGFGCGSCPNAFATTVPADGVFQTTIANPCDCVDPACAPGGPDPCAGDAPFVGYYGDDFGFACTTSTTVTTTTSTTATTVPIPVVCGDGIVAPSEECDPPGSLGCPSPTSPGGAFLACEPDCRCPRCPPFPFLIRTAGKIGDRGRVAGSIGANDVGGEFHFGKNAFQADGSTVAADQLGLGEGTSVARALGNTIRIGRGAVARAGSGTPTLPLTAPFCPIPEIACGGPDVVVPLGELFGPLAPGSYGTLVVLRGGALSLAPGLFTFCAVRTSKQATIAVTGTAQTTIDVAGTLRLADGSTLAPASGTPTPRLNVAGTLVRVSQSSLLQAFLSAPNAVLTLGRRATVAGAFCVARSQSDKHVTLECPPPSPGGAFLDAP